jgi:hypothetical protein
MQGRSGKLRRVLNVEQVLFHSDKGFPTGLKFQITIIITFMNPLLAVQLL